MPKIIVTSRYMRNTPKRTASNLVKYMGTRQGVEKLLTGVDRSLSTVRQQRLIASLLKTDSKSKKYLEYQDYEAEPTKSNATEFIDAFIERNADRIGGMKKLVSYMAERPGVEKLGSHGLFSQTDEKIDLDAVADEVGNHEGIIWTHVVSLRREDAERLGYNNAAAWKKLVRRNIIQVAEAQKIDIDNLQWYAAFHNTTHHPHMHLLMYAKDAKQGWLTKKGIDEMRGIFGNDIFRNEQYKLFTMETQLRDELKETVRQRLEELLARAEAYSPSPEMAILFQRLNTQLDGYTGKKVYGYLPSDMKETIDKIVSGLAKDESIAALYSEWNKINTEKLSIYYDKAKPEIPLADNTEFRSIKNAVIKAAMQMTQTIQSGEFLPQTVNHAVSGLVKALCKLIGSSCNRKLSRLHGQIDHKLKLQIEQKKAALGIRTDCSVQEYSGEDEDEEQGFGMYL